MTSVYQRGIQKVMRIVRRPGHINAELRFLIDGLQPLPDDPRISAEGWNWKLAPEKPIAIVWGVAKWKRGFISAWLSDYRVICIRGDASIRRVKMKLEKEKYFSWSTEGMHFYRWGKQIVPRSGRKLAGKIGQPIRTIEDGFLRSCQPGVQHVRPHSLVFDNAGIYYDSRKKSDIEIKLNKSNITIDEESRKLARDGLKVFRALSLSKYYPLVDGVKPIDDIDDDLSYTLVLGQVESDESLKFGTSRFSLPKQFNLELVRKALKTYPTSTILYRPHPDTIFRPSRAQRNQLKAIHKLDRVFVVDNRSTLKQSINIAERVMTYTSLSGFEALIYEKPTHIVGRPFYGGWGLTNDERVHRRRKSKLSLENVFYATYFDYAKYMHPASEQPSDFFEIASYFLVERVKHGDVLRPSEQELNLKELNSISDRLSTPAQLLLYLQTRDFAGDAELDKLTALVNKVKLEEFGQFACLLTQSANYDGLIPLCKRIVPKFEDEFKTRKYDFTFMDTFLSDYITVQKTSNGRPMPSLPNIGSKLVALNSEDNRYGDIVISYAHTLSNNLEYDRLESLIENLKKTSGITDRVYIKLCSILTARPTRNERDFGHRHRLLGLVGLEYKQKLDERYPSHYDLFLNSALSARAVDNLTRTKRAYDKFVEQYPSDSFQLHNPLRGRFGAVSRRLGDLYALESYFRKNKDYTRAKSIFEGYLFPEGVKLDGSLARVKERLDIQAKSGLAKHREVIRAYHNATKNTQNTASAVSSYARALRGVGELENAHKTLYQFTKNVAEPNKRASLNAELDKISFLSRTNQILNSYPQPTLPKGVIFLASQTCFNTLAMMTPALVALKKRGYAVINLMEGMGLDDPTGIPYIDKFSGSLSTRLYQDKLEHDWEVNWKEKTLVASGINFYQGFYERLSTQHRRFHVDINMPKIADDFKVQMHRSDLCLKLCEQIYSEIVERGINAVLVCGNSHVAPFSTFRDYARHKDDPKLSFISCNVAYELYFSNLGSKFAHTMCVTDMTLHRNRRAPFFALPEKFEKWYDENKDNPELQEKANELIRVNRNSAQSNASSDDLIDWLQMQRDAGKTIIAAFGKVPVDLNVPYDGGPAHTDMADWITNTVDILNGRDDIILLVKPHPHELRPEVALDLVSSFTDLIEVPISDNVKILGHREINTHAIAPFLDLAILYNGSSSLELTALGVPVMMTAYFGQHDYPVDFIYPQNRKQYAQYLTKKSFKKPTKELRKRAAFVISYQGTDDVSIRNEYSARQITNDKVGYPTWHEKNVKKFLEEGDPAMDKIAGRMVEKFEGPTL